MTQDGDQQRGPIVPPPVIGLLCALVIWLTTRWLPDLTLSFPGQNGLALAVGVAGLAIDAVAILSFIRARTTVNPLSPNRSSALVTDGLFGWSRNPMYLGMALLLIAWTIYLGAPIGLIVVGAFVVLINKLQIEPEEAALSKLFGRDYEAYKASVRRWL